MFPILATALAIVICLTGLDPSFAGDAKELNPLSILLLSIIPLGEIAVFIARKKADSINFKTARVVFSVFGLLPNACLATGVFFLEITALPHVLGMEGWPLVDKLILILVYLSLSNTVRIYRYRFARALRYTAPSFSRTGLRIALRGELTLILPFLLFMLLHDLVTLNETLDLWFTHLPLLFWAALILMFLGLVCFMPAFIRILWRLKPLPKDSLIRGELSRFMDRLDFKARDILVWDTQGLIMNAAILGFLPRFRYILFTDAMLRGLNSLELKSVFAHEIGHGKKKHITLYLFFSCAFIFGLTLLENFIPPLVRIEEPLEILLPGFLVVIGLYWWIVFGFLSRRFEMEADIFGAHAVGSPALFIHTLGRVATLGRVEKRKSSWRHFSIERRMAALKQLFLVDPAAATRFWRKMKWTRRALFASSLIVTILFAGNIAKDSVAGFGYIAASDGDWEKGEKYLKLALDLPLGEIHAWSLLSVHLKSDQPEKALPLLENLCRDHAPETLPEFVRLMFMETGLNCLRNQENELAVRAWDRALELFPGDSDLTDLQALTHEHMQGNPQPLNDWIEQKKAEMENGRIDGSNAW